MNLKGICQLFFFTDLGFFALSIYSRLRRHVLEDYKSTPGSRFPLFPPLATLSPFPPHYEEMPWLSSQPQMLGFVAHSIFLYEENCV